MASVIQSIYIRGPFKSSSDGSSSTSTNHTCALPNPLKETPTDPIAGEYTFHTLGTIIAGSAAAFSVLSILILMLRHATHFSRPNEQLKILRICLLIPVNSVLQFIGQLVPEAYFYITPWADMMQALALGNFFLLLLEFISPHDNQRDFFFSGLQVPAKRSKNPPRNGLKWYRRKWIAVFQFPVIQLLVAIATDVTQSPKLNIYCANSNKPYFAHLWINLIHVLSTLTAVISCLRFYKILKAELAGHKPLSKLFAFKMLVGLNILMNVVFWILNDINPSPLSPTNTMNEADAVAGIPAIVNCVIMVPFSVFFHYAYDVGPYIIDRPSGSERGERRAQYLHYQGGFLGLRAFASMLNPGEILGAIGFMFKMRGRRSSNSSSSGAAATTSTTNGYAVNSVEGGRDAGRAIEMSRRDQRRMEKHGCGNHSSRYDQRRADNAPYGWTSQQNGGYGQGQHQQSYR